LLSNSDHLRTGNTVVTTATTHSPLSFRANLESNSGTLPPGSHEKRSMGCAASERSNLHLPPVPLSTLGERHGWKTTSLTMTKRRRGSSIPLIPVITSELGE